MNNYGCIVTDKDLNDEFKKDWPGIEFEIKVRIKREEVEDRDLIAETDAVFKKLKAFLLCKRVRNSIASMVTMNGGDW